MITQSMSDIINQNLLMETSRSLVPYTPTGANNGGTVPPGMELSSHRAGPQFMDLVSPRPYPPPHPLFGMPFPPGFPYSGAGFTLLPMSGGFEPRRRFLIHEEPKPQHSYIGLIAIAILSSEDNQLVLSDIYQHILDSYAYFRTRGPGWRNSIRHNLSLNDCFIKAARSANGKGHYWAIHPACKEDFKKGDFRRRRAQRKVRRHMGLSVPDDEDDDSPPPSNQSPWFNEDCQKPTNQNTESVTPKRKSLKRRGFDIDSLLAPDDENDEEEINVEDEEPRDGFETINHELLTNNHSNYSKRPTTALSHSQLLSQLHFAGLGGPPPNKVLISGSTIPYKPIPMIVSNPSAIVELNSN